MRRYAGAELPDDVDDEIDPLTYTRAQAARVRAQLQQHQVETAPPSYRERLERDLAAWDRQVAQLTLDEHWTTGEGDRKLF